MYNLPENEIIKQYSEGLTLTDLKKIYNIGTYEPIKRILKKNNIELRRYTNKRENKLKLDIDYFKTIDTVNKAYWLGFICADGYISKSGYKLHINLKFSDINHLEKFKNEINSSHKISTRKTFDKRTQKTYTKCSIQITSKAFVQNIIDKGITTNKSYYCTFPSMESKYYSHFIRGLFDGDGSINFNKKSYRVKLIGTSDILNFIQNYLIKTTSYSKRELKKCGSTLNMYKFTIYKNSDIKIFLNYIYKNCNGFNRLDRKYKLFKSIII